MDQKQQIYTLALSSKYKYFNQLQTLAENP